MSMRAESPVSPEELSRWLGQKFPPTPQQASVIEHPLEPLLVVAGAGAGKTETMAARVVWQVANGMLDPDRVIGLTFTRKAAQQLAQRMRTRLVQLAGIPQLQQLDPTGQLAQRLRSSQPQAMTYDAFAGQIVAEFGLLLPVEPQSRIISQTELYMIASDVVREYQGPLHSDKAFSTVVERLVALSSEMDNHMVDAADILEESRAFVEYIDERPRRSNQGKKLNGDMMQYRTAQLVRAEYLPLVKKLKETLSERNLMTFGEQMSIAARLAQEHPLVRKHFRQRYDAIFLDEYQDTSHAQRILLSSLFAGCAVTAVGDPMQSIYGWRGATAANLDRFMTDFVAPYEPPAQKKELTMSFRNPSAVLEMANTVANAVLGPPTDSRRPVQPLVSVPNREAGTVELGFYATKEEEIAAVAQNVAKVYQQRDRTEPFTAAVLVRKNYHMAPIAAALRMAGVPVEIVGSEALLDIPEIADLVAIATVLIRPYDSPAALRVLTSPMVGLGMADILQLARRSKQLSRQMQDPHDTNGDTADVESLSPEDQLRASLEALIPTRPDLMVGLGDVLADLGDAAGYSPTGLARLRKLGSQLRELRTYALGYNLPELFVAIEQVMGIRTEILARENPYADGAAGLSHLERFYEEVQQFAAIPGASLPKFLDYLTQARTHDKGLSAGEVRVNAERVQIMTVHKAKGLEWQYVYVVHADSSTYDNKTTTWVKNEAILPSTLRGDARENDEGLGMPVFEPDDAWDRKELEVELKAHMAEFKEVAGEETIRLFYVALTRAETYLSITGSADPTKSRTVKPYQQLELLKQHYPASVVAWAESGAASDDVDEAAAASANKYFPSKGLELVAKRLAPAVTKVKAAYEQLPEYRDEKEIYQLWERDVTALIEEHERHAAATVNVPLSNQLTATDIVAFQTNPEQFARRQRRPIPFKPNAYAKRGTGFHAWLEHRFAAQDLFADTVDEAAVEDPILIELQQKFLASPWADRTPTYVEHPFEVLIDGVMIRGRMDAIFAQPDGSWLIVDWKTGKSPNARELHDVRVQLAMYRIAWAKMQQCDPANVQCAFYYVRDEKLLEVADLPDEAEIAKLMRLKAED
ncbi:DEAD/DEAH box helicase [Corynebacterium sp. HS2168-gen11]|uniref:ATP-dependent helicase n=1 Tax=Corynebacterium sp. HS2168-gen11 TaxID=2974027 RepID=UPI00216B0E0C|nr:DEAD/DEAH box helicase [Corynebacterium sp. HS2168-gen11]